MNDGRYAKFVEENEISEEEDILETTGADVPDTQGVVEDGVRRKLVILKDKVPP